MRSKGGILRPRDGSAESEEEQEEEKDREEMREEREPSRNARIPILIQQPAKVIICRLSATDSSFGQSPPRLDFTL